MRTLSEQEVIERFGVVFYRDLLANLYQHVINTDEYKNTNHELLINQVIYSIANSKCDYDYAYVAVQLSRKNAPINEFQLLRFILGKEKELIDFMLDIANEAKTNGANVRYENQLNQKQ